MRIVLLLTIFSLSLPGFAKQPDFRWKIVTSPYRNYIYPGQTGLQYRLNYMYSEESKALRKYLRSNFDVESSEMIKTVYRNVSTGYYFDRYFDIKIKYLKPTDTLIVKTKYENGDSTVEKYYNVRGNMKFLVPLTKFKNQHDFAAGTSKSPYQKGLVTCVDVFVQSPHPSKKHVSILTKFVTEANLPGTLSRVKGRSILRK